MRMRTVGASGLKVSAIGLGSLTWGGQTDARKVRSLVRRFVDAGGNLVDTAPAYGGGFAEQLIGKLTHTDISRDDLVIATKAGFIVEGHKRIVDTSRSALLRDLEGSLRRLTPITSIFGKFMPGEMPPSKKPVRHSTMP